MPSSVIGGAMLPHAPQFFTMPETEDRATVARVKEVAREIGSRLKALKPDLWIIFANDHAEQFFHNVAPAFTVHVGCSASGSFVGRPFHWRVPGETGFEIVRKLYRQGFDTAFTSTANIDYAIGIPLTHLGIEDPILPISINAYLPPQPTMERCCAFGAAVGRIVAGLGLRTVALASGGMSDFPRGRHARRAQARYRLDGPELAPQLRLARLVGWPSSTRGTALSVDQAGTGRADRGAARDCPRGGASRGISRRPRGLCRTLQADPGSARCARRPRPQGGRRDGHHTLLPFLARMQVERSGR